MENTDIHRIVEELMLMNDLLEILVTNTDPANSRNAVDYKKINADLDANQITDSEEES